MSEYMPWVEWCIRHRLRWVPLIFVTITVPFMAVWAIIREGFKIVWPSFVEQFKGAWEIAQENKPKKPRVKMNFDGTLSADVESIKKKMQQTTRRQK